MKDKIKLEFIARITTPDGKVIERAVEADGLNLVMAILGCTAETKVPLNVLSMNVAHVLRAFLRLFSGGAAHCFGRLLALFMDQ